MSQQLLIGRYLVLKQLGTGGFSETYLARDKYLPGHSFCVVKRLKLSANCPISPETARRLFEGEARVLGRLGQNNSQIPSLLAYCSDAEETYLVQEYVEGENLGEWVSQGRRLTSAGAIELLLQVLPILAYIHSLRIIHRDIKPSNLLQRKSDGKIVLIDFGAACCLEEGEFRARPDEETLAIGTPGYMPNEQQLGMAEFSSDLYALGIAVIHLLTGIQPNQFQQEIISGELNWQNYLQPQGQTQAVDPALITFLDQMVRSKCHDRYASAEAALTALNTLVNQRKRSPRRLWTQHRGKPLMLKPIVALFALSLAAGYLVRSVLAVNSTEVQMTLLREVATPFNVGEMLIAPNARLLVCAGTDRVLRLWSLPEGKQLKPLVGHQSPITALSMSQNSRLLASSDANTIHLWDSVSGGLLQTFRVNSRPVTAIAISPDGQNLVSGSQDGTLHIWQLTTGRLVRILREPPNFAVTAITFGASANQIITASSNFQLQVWNLQTGERERVFAGHQAEIVGLEVTDRQTLMSFGKDRTLVWDLKSGTLKQALSEKSTQPVTASVNQSNMMTVNQEGIVRLWDKEAEQFVWQASSQIQAGSEVAISPNHRYVVAWQPNRRLQIWQFNRED
ncbi:serine/threonine-protein kinase [Leptolyngbya ohadii]|uniref:serine/threonine-protein kinase n=1 Tax=Leptolyngbya ohadii TaxID=1962290 RepID=UPI00117AF6D7|nr:serine/threonine-protein kinase [Leptolyngbya ohadii]